VIGGVLRARELAIARRYALPHESAGIVWLRDQGYAAPERNSYAPTPWGLLRRMLSPAEVTEDDVFLDIGCGMGRIMLEAGLRYPFARVEGIELVPRQAAAAREALGRNEARLRCRSWEVVTTDVIDYVVPDDVTVAFLFDPFTGSLFDAAITRLEESVARRARPLTVLYVTPKERERLARSCVEVRSGSTRTFAIGPAYDWLVCELGRTR
jgi:SAM-dependent methyltransferase